VLFDDGVWHRCEVNVCRGPVAEVTYLSDGEADELDFSTDYVRLAEDDAESSGSEYSDESRDSENEEIEDASEAEKEETVTAGRSTEVERRSSMADCHGNDDCSKMLHRRSLVSPVSSGTACSMRSTAAASSSSEGISDDEDDEVRSVDEASLPKFH